MRRLALVLVALALIVPLGSPSAQALSIASPRAVLLTPEIAAPLWARQAATRHAPASLAKVMTVVLAIESGRMDETVRISAAAAAVGGSALYVRPGEEYTLRELVYAAMLISANDASQAIAEHLSTESTNFIAMMNARARELGMQNSNFANAHGLPHPEQYSTAQDLAILGLHAATLPEFLTVAGRGRMVLHNNRVLVNQNRSLGAVPGVIGGKTGFTDEAGQCFMVIARRDGLIMASVVLGAVGGNMWSDSTALLEHGFANYRRQILVRARQTLGVVVVPLTGPVLLISDREVSRTIARTASEEHRVEIDLPKRLLPPLRPGVSVGQARILQGDEVLGTVELNAPVFVPLLTPSRVATGAGVLVLLTAYLAWRRKRWKKS